MQVDVQEERTLFKCVLCYKVHLVMTTAVTRSQFTSLEGLVDVLRRDGYLLTKAPPPDATCFLVSMKYTHSILLCLVLAEEK